MIPISDQTFLISGRPGSAKFFKVSVATIMGAKKQAHFKDSNISIEPEHIKIARNCDHWCKDDDSE